MITKNVKGITWVGNMYQKFENMFLEAEDVMYEDAVKYIENQMQAVGVTFKKIYSDIMEDLLPPNEKVSIELPIDKHADAGFCKKPFHAYIERQVKAGIKQTTDDSRIDHDVTSSASYNGTSEAHALFMPSLRNSVKERKFSSPSRQCVGRMDVKSNLGFDENPVNKKMATTKMTDGTTLAETDACKTSQSCGISNENQIKNHGVSMSKPASAEVAVLASTTDCSNEIENASSKQFPNDLLPVKLAEEKQIGVSSSYCLPFEDAVEQGHETMQQDHLKLEEETCVMVNGDVIQLPPRASGSLNTNKKKMRKTFSLSKKSARKQEYKELAVWHMNNEKVSDCMENLDPTLPQDQKELLLPSMSETEWELL